MSKRDDVNTSDYIKAITDKLKFENEVNNLKLDINSLNRLISNIRKAAIDNDIDEIKCLLDIGDIND
jgi:hypothetical protein